MFKDYIFGDAKDTERHACVFIEILLVFKEPHSCPSWGTSVKMVVSRILGLG